MRTGAKGCVKNSVRRVGMFGCNPELHAWQCHPWAVSTWHSSARALAPPAAEGGGLGSYALAIHCGGCMIDQQKIRARILDLQVRGGLLRCTRCACCGHTSCA